MATDKRILYHWTLRENLASIEYRGLDPAEATGELYAVWGCELGRVEWARDHVASRHKWAKRNLVLLRVEVWGKRVYRTCWDGVFYTPETIYATAISVADGRNNFTPLEAFLDREQKNRA